jgi:hypothetical protein
VLLVVEDVVDFDAGRVDGLIEVIMDENGIELIIFLEGLIDGMMVGLDTKENPDAIDTVGASVGATKLKPDGTKFGSNVLVYVYTVGTAIPVGATVGTSGKSTEVKTLGGSEFNPGVACCGMAAFGTRTPTVWVMVGSNLCTNATRGPTKSAGSPLTTTAGNSDGLFPIWRSLKRSIRGLNFVEC